MKACALVRSSLLLGGLALSCTGLDPQQFGPDRRTTALGGQAGYSYDAGLADAGWSSSAGQAAVTGRPAAGGAAGTLGTGGSGAPADAAGGEGGADEHGAVAGRAAHEPATAGGDGGSAGGSLRGGAGGGAGLAGTGGVAGRAGSTGSGGGGGAGTAGAAGRLAGGTAGGAPDGGSSGAASGGTLGGSAEPGGAGGLGGTGGLAEPGARAFTFSEYVEGSGSYKALELRAEQTSLLDGCRLVTYSNGADTGAGIALTGSVAAGSVYTLCSSTLADLLGATCDRSTNLSFNGDDTVALECDGVLLDIIGQIGFDPGTAWTGPAGSTLNATLRRRCERPSADPDGTDAFEPDATYLPLPVDTFDGLGDPACG